MKLLDFVLLLALSPAVPDRIEVLGVESLGIPSPSEDPAARRISEIRFHDGRLFIGTGDAVTNTGRTPVLSLDPSGRKVETEFVVDEEAIYAFRVLDGQLAIPGSDATEDWDWGNIYLRARGGWVKRRTLPRAIHVIDLASFGGKWFAATGTLLEPGGGVRMAAGAILSSDDEGGTWHPEYLTASSSPQTIRVTGLAPFGGRLFAFSSAFAAYPGKEVPEAVRESAGDESLGAKQGNFILYVPDPQGAAESLVRTEQGWQPIDLVPADSICGIEPVVFRDRLLLSVFRGRRVAAFAAYLLDGPAPVPGATSEIYAFDGEKSERLPLEYDLLRDFATDGERLALLVLAKGHHYVVETKDLEHFRWRALPLGRAKPLSIEMVGSTYFVGVADGRLFRTTGRSSFVDSPDEIGALRPARGSSRAGYDEVAER